MRRRRAEPRTILPDSKYNSVEVARLIGRLLRKGKKTVAQGIIYQAFDRVGAQTRRNPAQVLQEALRNTKPLLEVKPRRVGGATYQVPVEVRQNRSEALGMRWIIDAARARKGRPMAEKLAEEILAAARGEGAAVKRKEDLHKMAEANRAFAHYRW